MKTDEAISLYPFSKKRLFFVTTIGLLLPVIGWLAVSDAIDGRWPDAVFLGLLSVPLAILDWWVWRRLLSDRPALILTADALIEQASLFGSGEAARSEIADVRIERQSFFKMVVVEFHQRGVSGRSRAVIPSVLLDSPAETLAEDIQAWVRKGRRY